MMGKQFRIQFISKGFHDLLCSDGVYKLVESTAEDIASKANSIASNDDDLEEKPRYEVKGPKIGNYGGGRVIAYMSAANGSAVIDESRHATIEKALGGRR